MTQAENTDEMTSRRANFFARADAQVRQHRSASTGPPLEALHHALLYSHPIFTSPAFHRISYVILVATHRVDQHIVLFFHVHEEPNAYDQRLHAIAKRVREHPVEIP